MLILLRIATVSALLWFSLPAAAEDWSDMPAVARALTAAGFHLDDVSLILDDGQAAHFPDAGLPMPPGSLVKPFLVMAYAESRGELPRMTCPGGDRCWLPAGHGYVGPRQALAQSCNHYFDRLAADIDPSRLVAVLNRYGVPPPPPNVRNEALWGLGDDWLIPPRTLLAAYRELARRRADPHVARVLSGLHAAAREGTAAPAALPDALAKTGTAPCVHGSAAGDGYAIFLYPSDSARYTILLRVHGSTGRTAARAAGVALKTIVGQ